jgi:uncharacterized repeat protein (TIGR01451 family)
VSHEAQLEAATVESAVSDVFKDASEGIYLIRLADAPLASYRGGVDGLEATSPAVTGTGKLDVDAPASVAYVNYLEAAQATFVARMEKAIGHEADVRFTYKNADNGVAVWLTPEEATRVRKLPGVVFVQADFERELQTDVGPSWIGADSIWGAPACDAGDDCGEGIIVGVIDTGINPENPSFADIGGDGYDHTNPFGAGNYVGVCDPSNAGATEIKGYDSTFPCNDKLIGAWGFESVDSDFGANSPWDYDGHGSHTSSTAAGNFVDATITGDARAVDETLAISGVAPHANIIMYAGCCTGSALAASIDQAIADGVDVINYSIGSNSASDVWNDFDTVGFRNAREAGIFVATSAGNNGPGDETVGSPADAPWLTSAGASTHSRSWANTVTFTGGDTTLDPISGTAFTDGYGPAAIVYAGDYGDALCLDPFTAGTFSGEIVVCDRGTNGRVEKGANAAAGGAGGFILANDAANGLSINSDAHVIPAAHISYDDGVGLKAWLASGTGHMATISAGVYDLDPANGDIMASFSSRGPNGAIEIVSPSVTAPGVDIIAALGTSTGPGADDEWGFESGTSMASPHVAGAGALLMQQHPDWTPAEIQSALMLTAETGVLDSDESTPATPFGMGNGRVDLSVANDAGLIMNETNANYVGADPAIGGDPKTLNLPSMANSQCVIECSWERTVTATTSGTWTTAATADAGVSLSVSPTNLTLNAGESGTVTVTADVSGAPSGVWAFGEVTLTAAGIADSHLPVAVMPSTGDFPDLVEIEARRDAGSVHVTDLTAIEIYDFTVTSYGLTAGDVSTFLLAEDPTNDDPYDSGAGTWVTTVVVPVGAQRLVAETFDTTAPDLDLYVGTGSSPSAATQVCMSASGSAEEYCNIDAPTPGTYWVLVQNWESSDTADTVSVSVAAVSADEGNLTLEGPTSQAQLDPFDIDILWDLTDPALGDKYYGALGLDTGDAGPLVVAAARNNIGVINVDLDRVEDDVSKTALVDGSAEPGSVVTFQIVVEPNPTAVDLDYTVEDVLPAGLTYVPDSATGGLVYDGGTLTWSGTMPAVGEAFYTITDSDTDPMCDTGFGGYVDLAAYDIYPDDTVEGDTTAWAAFSGQNPFQFYDDTYTGVSFTDDGFIVFGSGYGGAPWVPQAVPNEDPPNNLLAAFWHDFEVVYDAGANTGVSLATAGADTSVVEYDDLVEYGDTESVLDMSVVLYSTVDNTPGYYEAVVAFDNVSSTPVGTIGVENSLGTTGTALLNNGDSTGVISDGYQVCFDLTPGLSDPVVLTYDAVVSPDAESSVITNEVSHTVDQPGGKTEVASYDLNVGVPVPPTDGATLVAEDILAESLTLVWDEATDASGIAAYHVYQDGDLIDDVDGDVTEYAVSGLTGSTTYDFEVVAEDVPGNLSDGVTLTVTTATDFTDDDFSIFEKDIEWLSGMGITKGCNPPVNDHYCPNDTLTRGELAAMINRAFNLPAATDDYFTDDDDSIFEDAINRLAEAGITKGCDVAGTMFCPDAEVTRGEIAAFFDRAMTLPATSTDYFTDDDDSIFEGNINRLAEAGITKGCNPPANDNYCPNDFVTRGQIAAFFHRALG